MQREPLGSIKSFGKNVVQVALYTERRFRPNVTSDEILKFLSRKNHRLANRSPLAVIRGKGRWGVIAVVNLVNQLSVQELAR